MMPMRMKWVGTGDCMKFSVPVGLASVIDSLSCSKTSKTLEDGMGIHCTEENQILQDPYTDGRRVLPFLIEIGQSLGLRVHDIILCKGLFLLLDIDEQGANDLVMVSVFSWHCHLSILKSWC